MHMANFLQKGIPTSNDVRRNILEGSDKRTTIQQMVYGDSTADGTRRVGKVQERCTIIVSFILRIYNFAFTYLIAYCLHLPNYFY